MGKVASVRLIVQMLLLIVFSWGLFFGLTLSPALVLPVMVCRYIKTRTVTCAFGILQRQLTLQLPSYIFPIVSLGALIIICIISGKLFCGWACPLGLVQDLLIKARLLLKKGFSEISQRLHLYLADLKYGFLFIMILLSLSIGLTSLLDVNVGLMYQGLFPGAGTGYGLKYKEPWCTFCAAPPIFIFLPGFLQEFWTGTQPILLEAIILPILILAVFIAGSFALRRFWCRYVCPLGALMAFFHKYSLIWKKKDIDKCTKCGVCEMCCPMRVTRVMEEDRDVDVSDPECIFCFCCVENCPEKGALEVKVWNKTILTSGV